jgi:hypothetical protein
VSKFFRAIKRRALKIIETLRAANKGGKFKLVILQR